MGSVFLNKTLIIFQSIALFLFIMLIIFIIAVSRMKFWEFCLLSSCMLPVYLVIFMIYTGGTLLSPIRIEIFDNSIFFTSLIPSRSKSIPFNRIKRIEAPKRSRSSRIIIVDDHGYEHKFYMINHKISNEIMNRYRDYKKKK